MNKQKVLLDTHIWIRICNGDSKLRGSPLSDVIEKAAREKSLFLSIISIWELGLLTAKKRLALSMPCEEWVNFAIQKTSATIAELTPKIALQSCALLDLHADPADRIIVATAIENRATLVTQDRKIIEYAAKNNILALST